MSDQPNPPGGQDPNQPPQPQQPQWQDPAAQQPAGLPPQQYQPQPQVQPLSGPQPDLPFPLQQGEQVLEVVRRHWWFLWPFTLWLVIVAFAPVIIAGVLLNAIGVLDDFGWFFWIPALLWIGFWGVRALFNWYRYQNDIWVITNQRIIDVFRSNPLNKRIATADLINVQDLNVSRSGIIPSMLGFGDLLLSTAGTEGGAFRITGVPHAEELQLLIDKERDRERMRRA